VRAQREIKDKRVVEDYPNHFENYKTGKYDVKKLTFNQEIER
jgi:hypothetical protein